MTRWKARLAETQEALKNLRAEKKMLEDLEIVKAIRSMNTGNMDVLEMVAKIQGKQGREKPCFFCAGKQTTYEYEQGGK